MPERDPPECLTLTRDTVEAPACSLADMAMTPSQDYAVSGPGGHCVSVGRITGPHVTNARFGLATLANMVRTKAPHWAAVLDVLIDYPFQIYREHPIVRGDATRLVQHTCLGIPDRPALYYMHTRTTEMFAEAVCLFSAMAAVSRWLMQFPEFGRHQSVCETLDVSARDALHHCANNDNGRASGGRLTHSFATMRGRLLDAFPYSVHTLSAHVKQVGRYNEDSTRGDRVYPVLTEELAVRAYITALAGTQAPAGWSGVTRTSDPRERESRGPSTPFRWGSAESKNELRGWMNTHLGNRDYHAPFVQGLLRDEAFYAIIDLCNSMNAYFDTFGNPERSPEAARLYEKYLMRLDAAVVIRDDTTYDRRTGQLLDPYDDKVGLFIEAWRHHLSEPLLRYFSPSWPYNGRVNVDDFVQALAEMALTPQVLASSLTSGVSQRLSEAPSLGTESIRARMKQRTITSGHVKQITSDNFDDECEHPFG